MFYFSYRMSIVTEMMNEKIIHKKSKQKECIPRPLEINIVNI